MRRYQKHCLLLAIGLAALAGFDDALGFLNLGGLFADAIAGAALFPLMGLEALWLAAAVAALLLAGAMPLDHRRLHRASCALRPIPVYRRQTGWFP